MVVRDWGLEEPQICIDTIEQGSKLHHKGEGDICCHREIFGQAYIQHREC